MSLSILLVIGCIFVGNLICNILGVLYQRAVISEQHIKATAFSMLTAGLSLIVWRVFLKEEDITASAGALISYLSSDGIGTFVALKYKSKAQAVS